MKYFTVLFLFAIAFIPSTTLSQVIDLPADQSGGFFKDTSTGLTWMDVDRFFGKNLDQIRYELIGTGFRPATRAEVVTLFQSLPTSIFDTAVITGGLSVPTTCCRQIAGIYNDNESGSDPNTPGLAQQGWAVTIGDTTNSIVDDAELPPANWRELIGAWVVQAPPSLCASSQPHSYDMDCDGIDEKAIWRASTGTWFIRLSKTNELIIEQWGLPGDYPILGDFDGDAIADLGVWRPTNGTWYIKTSSSSFDATQAIVKQFGLPGDYPLRQDYDNDGVFDFAVWRPSEGNYYYYDSSSKTAMVEQWGLAGDVPLGSFGK